LVFILLPEGHLLQRRIVLRRKIGSYAIPLLERVYTITITFGRARNAIVST
jgi:hypothetical protein